MYRLFNRSRGCLCLTYRDIITLLNRVNMPALRTLTMLLCLLAPQSHANSIYSASMQYLNTIDGDNKFESLQSMAEHRDPDAQAHLGTLLLACPAASCRKDALQWLNYGYSNGSLFAQIGLSEVYRKGLGVRHFPYKALALIGQLQSLSNEGNREASKILAYAYSNGLGVEPDIKRANLYHARVLP